MKHTIIIGGGSAGLSAALLLGRSLRKVTVINSGKPRNWSAEQAHNLLGREGINPLDLLATGRKEISQFSHVEMIDKKAISVKSIPQGFRVILEDETELEGEKLLLATGVVDKLPSIPGLEAFWGKNAFGCPYCHGYEVKDAPLAVYIQDAKQAYDFALLVSNWSKDLILLTDGAKALTDLQAQHLKELSIAIYEQPIKSFKGQPGEKIIVELANGATLERKGLFFRGKIEQGASFAQDIGCEITEQGFIKVDSSQRTTVPGVYAVGDMTTPIASVANAIAQGVMAGVMINLELTAKLKLDVQKMPVKLSSTPQPQFWQQPTKIESEANPSPELKVEKTVLSKDNL
jgi:thioredoxin reductase